ncbi:hypothetical protein [Paracoccus sediminilitoris]|uniref:hypothetical protein n=1 Tax=Paracoccus sediminilitoris TaxID=2202419 RepID=UPI0027296B4D|nr:hypothetical protein [Paracoccus sediminilitoris]
MVKPDPITPGNRAARLMRGWIVVAAKQPQAAMISRQPDDASMPSGRTDNLPSVVGTNRPMRDSFPHATGSVSAPCLTESGQSARDCGRGG